VGNVDASIYQSTWLTCIGIDFEQFAVTLNLSPIPEAAQFVAREPELAEMHQILHGHSKRSTVVLQDVHSGAATL